MNNNSSLDPQNETHALAHMSAEEVQEAKAWFDEREDRWLEAAYEARTEMDF